MNIQVNGKTQYLNEDKLNIEDLLLRNDVTMVDMVSVQLNGQFVKKENFIETFVQNNDSVDFLYFMGGGSLMKFFD